MSEPKPMTEDRVNIAITDEYAVTDDTLRKLWAELQAERAARAAAERERDEALKAFTLGVVERDELRGVVQRREQATENLIRSAIIAADFIEGEYADGNDDGDIIPVSSPAYKIHERLWGAIFKADLPDGAVVLAARTNGAAQ